MHDAEFKTDRLFLRKLRTSDVDRLVAITNDLEIASNLVKTPHPYRTEDARALIARGVQSHSRIWAIEDTELVGVMGLRGEFGFWLEKNVWGRGYATEAGIAIIDHGFECLGYEQLIASPFRDNAPSRRVLGKLAFEEISTGSVFSMGQSKTVQVVHMRLEKSRWESMRSGMN